MPGTPTRTRLGHVLLIVILLVASAPALLLGTAGTASAAVTPTISVTNPGPTAFGATATIRVAVRQGASRQPVTLQRRTTSGWAKVAAKKLPTTGRVKKVTFNVKVTWAGKRVFRTVLSRKDASRGVAGKPFGIKSVPRTFLASHLAGGTAPLQASTQPSVSANGRFVAFISAADLGEGANGQNQVYLWDRQQDSYTLVSHLANGEPGAQSSAHPVISANGAYVAFATSAVLVEDDFGGNVDVYRWQRSDDTFEVVSRAGSTPATGTSDFPSISADGTSIAFQTDAPNIAGGGIGTQDVVLWDEGDSSPELVSQNEFDQAANADSTRPALSADGDHVAFQTAASNLDSAPFVDANGWLDVYHWTRNTNGPILVSTAADGVTAADADSRSPSISGDGTRVAFESDGANINPADTDNTASIYLWDQNLAGASMWVSDPRSPFDSFARHATISANGEKVAFIGFWGPIADVGDDGTDDVVVWDRSSQTHTLVTRTPSGQQSGVDVETNSAPALSSDGTFVAFASTATDLVSGVTDAGSVVDVFLRGRLP